MLDNTIPLETRAPHVSKMAFMSALPEGPPQKIMNRIFDEAFWGRIVDFLIDDDAALSTELFLVQEKNVNTTSIKMTPVRIRKGMVLNWYTKSSNKGH